MSEQGQTAELVKRLREACDGHPAAKVAWPHRILHEAADALTASTSREAALVEALKNPTDEMIEAGARAICPWAFNALANLDAMTPNEQQDVLRRCQRRENEQARDNALEQSKAVLLAAIALTAKA